LTRKIRHELLLARSNATHLPDDAFVRLYKGSAYYAIDNKTGIYWAAGSTVPNHDSERAEVYSQDEGAYTIFVLRPGREWKVYDAGRDGPEARSRAMPDQDPGRRTRGLAVGSQHLRPAPLSWFDVAETVDGRSYSVSTRPNSLTMPFRPSAASRLPPGRFFDSTLDASAGDRCAA
jgi:hypothetical protein